MKATVYHHCVPVKKFSDSAAKLQILIKPAKEHDTWILATLKTSGVGGSTIAKIPDSCGGACVLRVGGDTGGQSSYGGARAARKGGVQIVSERGNCRSGSRPDALQGRWENSGLRRH